MGLGAAAQFVGQVSRKSTMPIDPSTLTRDIEPERTVLNAPTVARLQEHFESVFGIMGIKPSRTNWNHRMKDTGSSAVNLRTENAIHRPPADGRSSKPAPVQLEK